MEEQIITVVIKTQGEPCELDSAEIAEWYRSRIAGLLDPAYGTPQVAVTVERRTVADR